MINKFNNGDLVLGKIDKIGKIDPIPNPYGADDVGCDKSEFKQAGIDLAEEAAKPIMVQPHKTKKERQKPWENTYVKLPAFELDRSSGNANLCNS